MGIKLSENKVSQNNSQINPSHNDSLQVVNMSNQSITDIKAGPESTSQF